MSTRIRLGKCCNGSVRHCIHVISLDILSHRTLDSLAHTLNPLYLAWLYRSGFSRTAWILQDDAMETSVLKMLKLKHEVNINTLKEVHLDAIIMERLSASPRIVPMHSYCGTSLVVKNIPYSVLDEITPPPPKRKKWREFFSSRKQKVVSRNTLSPWTKLKYALEMAESLADLHGFSGGTIVHGDDHLGQWLRETPDDPLMLGDFNLAKILSYNTAKGEYCKTHNGRGRGNVSFVCETTCVCCFMVLWRF